MSILKVSSIEITITLKDNYAAIIDIVLMVLFIVIVLFFCIAWKTCPLIFHATMRRIIPELYYLEFHKKEEVSLVLHTNLQPRNKPRRSE